MGEQKHEHGSMDTTEQERMFAGMMQWTVWVLAIVAVALIFLAITQT
ncbi:MAG: aa3-type cytochrome c oxidase subunit IV [Pseudomonadota bacterium]